MRMEMKQDALCKTGGTRMNMAKKLAKKPETGAGSSPVHEQVYLNLRERILFGEMEPGQAVTIQGLTEALGAGMTPVREAIRRLISDGALVFQGNRRVIVPALTLDDLEQLIFIRKTIESELARRAAKFITPIIRDELEKIDNALDDAIGKGDVAGYLALNYKFHSVVYSQANAPVLTELADRLWLRFGPSLRVVCGRFGTQNLPDRHKDLLQALAANDSVAAGTAMEQDIDQGMEMVASVLAPAD